MLIYIGKFEPYSTDQISFSSYCYCYFFFFIFSFRTKISSYLIFIFISSDATFATFILIIHLVVIIVKETRNLMTIKMKYSCLSPDKLELLRDINVR